MQRTVSAALHRIARTVGQPVVRILLGEIHVDGGGICDDLAVVDADRHLAKVVQAFVLGRFLSRALRSTSMMSNGMPISDRNGPTRWE